jgi:pimeloyl-[acyl-carrier protein] methyl ester esterase
MRLLFLHGWGFDASIWDKVRAALEPIETIAWDRGYFGNPMQTSVDAPFIAVGHSLGSLILAGDTLPGCSGLIAINGFDRFAGEGLVAPRTLDLMRSRFAVSPESVLDTFRLRAGGQSRARPIDTARLAGDLDRLATDDARGKTQPLLVLHGSDDPILPPAMRDFVFAGAPRITLVGGGHLLPLSHPDECAGHIRAVLA